LSDCKNNYRAEHLFNPLYKNYHSAKSIGHLVLDNDPDGIFRRIPAIVRMNDLGIMPLGIQAALDYLGVERDSITFQNKVITSPESYPLNIPLDNKGRLFIRYSKRRENIREISMVDVLRAYKYPEQKILDLSMLKDKLVFFGNTSSRTARFSATTFESYYPTLLIQADAANNILKGKILKPVSCYTNIIILILLGLVLSSSALLFKKVSHVIYTAILLPLIITAGFAALNNFSLYVPMFTLISYFVFLFTVLIIYRYFNLKNSLVTSLQNLQEKIKLTERLAAIGEVSSRVAHEIRNPLNGIQLYTSLIKRENTGKEDMVKYLDIIDEEIQRLNRFLTSLLNFTRPKAPVIKSIELNNVIQSVMNILKAELEGKNIRVHINLPENLKLSADYDQIHEAFFNLIKNALDASDRGDMISIYAQKSGKGMVAIKMKDTGSGIPQEDLERIFAAFHTTKEKGTGLGLAVVKTIIEAHTGSISVTSKFGKGTEFNLELKEG
jgi:signal transduction histidine kinase